MNGKVAEEVKFYGAASGPTDGGDHKDVLRSFPSEIAPLCEALQGVVLHIFWSQFKLGIAIPDSRKSEVNLRSTASKLRRIVELGVDGGNVTQRRPTENRLVGNCRDFALLATAALRSHGIPARSRCGFAKYFTPGRFDDHWVVEVLQQQQSSAAMAANNAAVLRWRRFDPQIDDQMLKALTLLPGDFDRHDMATSGEARQFIPGCEAWLMCRRGGADPELFGFLPFGKGWDFLRGDLLRDALALAKLEILPWDFWFSIGPMCSALTSEQWEHLDRIAEMCVAAQVPGGDIDALRSLVATDPIFCVPAEWSLP